MGLSLVEQETTINIMRDSDICEIYTSDSTTMTKLDKLVKSEKAPCWKVKEEHRSQSGELIGKTYETNKRLISFRASIVTRDMTDEQRIAAADRIKKLREKNQYEKLESVI